MARVWHINNESEKKSLIGILQKAVQSANLNFMIGSGCSCPVIPTLGGIEKKIQDLLDAEESDEADLEVFAYLKSFLDAYEKQNIDSDAEVTWVLSNYVLFLRVIFQCLSKRENNILPKQATIFSTNYDLFVEKSFEMLGMQAKLNDGFNRTPLLSNRFVFSPVEFFNSVFNNGNLYNYQVQIPAINLVKVHGSLSWQSEGNNIVFTTDWLKKSIEDHKKLIVSKDKDGIRKFNQGFTVILPKQDKYKDAILNQTYYDLLRIYSNELDKENTLLIVIGFSFSDDHILEITKRALKNPTLKVVVFSHKSEEVKIFHQKFLPFNNVDIVFSESSEIAFSDACLFMEKVLPFESVIDEGVQSAK